ncbi:hypothetical protein [Candidatus Formimonas warabiya]|uniref:Uncharacterized protein n=1 Tax=Formimonas warabiya TaxID=1761012 RepID=A0A3G1KWM2_FORW1|nr:hypothetical protein [Candidatus Formimonas warabiya]ATW26874.1 hypothetical protein DCMF_20785 [Candidatus Formimonas warabiya]
MSMKVDDFAVEVEFLVGNVFHCGRFGFGGVADADFIKKRMYTAMACALASYYRVADFLKQQAIEEFLDKYNYYSDKRMEEIIEKKGECEVETIIKDFRELILELS